MITTDNLTVTFYDTDLRQNMTPFAFFNYMQDIAIRNADLNGIGWEYLRPREIFWVLSRIKLTVRALPHWQQKINLTTHPRSNDALFAFRDFDFTDETGEMLAHGDSYWLLLSRRTLKPLRINETLKDTGGCGDKTETFPDLKKLIIAGDILTEKRITVEYTDLDMNMHVNNAVYAKWSASMFDYEFRISHNLASMQINYLTAAKYGDKLLLKLHYDVQTDNYYLDCTAEDTGVKIYNAVMKWSKAD